MPGAWSHEALQATGIPTIPRVGFVVERDAERLADFNSNPGADIVAIDLTTWRYDREWA